jgi:putative DNA primase/helicase
MDHCNWVKRSSSIINSILSELAARLEAEKDWDPIHLIGFSNGTLNTCTGVFTSGHRAEDYLTFCLPYEFNPRAKCRKFFRFLIEASSHDRDIMELIRAGFRLTIMPKNINEPFPCEAAFDVKGPKGSGKGCLSEALQALVGGDYGRGIIKSASFSNPNCLAALIGKRLAIDPDASGRVSDPGVFNNIVSNEPVEIKLLYKNVHSTRLGVVIWRFFNDTPGASGGGVEGMGRRIITIPFDVTPKRKEPSLKAAIISEVAGIFNWVWSMNEMDMYDVLSSAGSVSSSAKASIDSAIDREPILRFLIETYPDGVEMLPATDLFQSWCRWCACERHESGSNTRFGAQVKKVVVGNIDRNNFQGVCHSRQRGGYVYTITPMRDFDIGAYYFGAQLKPAPILIPAPNPAQSKSAPPPASEELVYGVHSSSETSIFNIEDEANVFKGTGLGVEPYIPCTHHLEICSDANWAISSNNFEPVSLGSHLIPSLSSSSECHAELLGRVPADSVELDLMVVSLPSGRIIGCERSRLVMSH